MAPATALGQRHNTPTSTKSKAGNIRAAFAQARAGGLRVRDAAETLGLSEGCVIAAHVVGSAAGLALHATPVHTNWLALLGSLQACGPLMGLTRNRSTVIEKTGVYKNLSGNGPGGAMGLALGEDIDLRLFFNQWHAGFTVADGSNDPIKTSLQFFDRHGTAVHKIFAREGTRAGAWTQVLAEATGNPGARGQPSAFEAPQPAVAWSPEPPAEVNAAAFAQAWACMTDTHQFFGLLRHFGLQRQQAFRLVQGQYAHRLDRSAVRDLLMEAAFVGLPIMCFVGSPGCIQIHTGSVRRVEPIEVQGKQWLNVLDPGFNLHLRENLIDEVWVVEKPTSDGVVTSVEAFDAQGETMAMLFGARKPGQPELVGWRALAAHLPHLQTPIHTTA